MTDQGKANPPQDHPTPPHRHGPPPGDLNVTWTVVVGFVGAILIFVFIVGVQILFQRTQRAEYEQKVVSEVPATLAELRIQQLERIETYRLVNQKEGKAAIPIEQAMQLIARDPAILKTIAQAQPAGGQTQPAEARASTTASAQVPSASAPSTASQGGPP